MNPSQKLAFWKQRSNEPEHVVGAPSAARCRATVIQMDMCRICRTAEADSFEHTPPQKAFNDVPTTSYTLMEWLAREAGEVPAGTVEGRGSGASVLCEPCNTKTGSWYVGELVQFVRAGARSLADVPRLEFDALTEPRWAQFGVTAKPGKMEPHPLRIAKAIVTMMVASSEELGATHPELRDFVQDRTRFGLPGEFRLYLSLFAGPYARQTGLVRSIGLDGSIATFAEIAWPPFAYVLAVNTADQFVPSCDITSFAQVGYHDHMEIELELLVGFGHTAIPCDYRTRAMVERDRDSTG